MAWHAKATGGYNVESTEAIDNAYMAAAILLSQGWTLKSISALLGNAGVESGLNPWRWESDYVPTYNEFLGWQGEVAQRHGYGLFGFTPASNYINNNNQQAYSAYGYAPNFSDRAGRPSDGEAQLRYFIPTVSPNWTHNLFYYYDDNFVGIGVDISEFYWLTFEQFMAGYDGSGNEMSVAQLTGAFELCYEKPADWAAANTYFARVNYAEYLYNVLSQNPPVPVGGDSDFNIMFYLKPWWKK